MHHIVLPRSAMLSDASMSGAARDDFGTAAGWPTREAVPTIDELGRFDEAIEAKRAAIDAGLRSSPHPEASIAECLVEAGR